MSLQGPRSSPRSGDEFSRLVLSPMMDNVSGEITASVNERAVGVARAYGYVEDVLLGVRASGKDDSHTLALAVDVKINGTSCLTTSPKITHISGEASANASTAASGEGIVQAVIDGDNNAVEPGDVLTVNYTLTRTATPTTEMANAATCISFARKNLN